MNTIKNAIATVIVVVVTLLLGCFLYSSIKHSGKHPVATPKVVKVAPEVTPTTSKVVQEATNVTPEVTKISPEVVQEATDVKQEPLVVLKLKKDVKTTSEIVTVVQPIISIHSTGDKITELVIKIKDDKTGIVKMHLLTVNSLDMIGNVTIVTLTDVLTFEEYCLIANKTNKGHAILIKHVKQ